MKNTFAAMAIERLDDHLAALFFHELLKASDFVSNERRRNRAGEVQRIQFFIRFAQPSRTVEHERAMRVGETEQHRGIEIVGVGWRVLAHEDRVKVLEWILRTLIEKAE